MAVNGCFNPYLRRCPESYFMWGIDRLWRSIRPFMQRYWRQCTAMDWKRTYNSFYLVWGNIPASTRELSCRWSLFACLLRNWCSSSTSAHAEPLHSSRCEASLLQGVSTLRSQQLILARRWRAPWPRSGEMRLWSWRCYLRCLLLRALLRTQLIVSRRHHF